MRSALVLAVLAVLVCGCKKPRHDAPTTARDATTTATPDAAAVIVPDSPDALWRAYQAAHAGAVKTDADRIGRRIDALLSEEARLIIRAAADEMVAKLPALELPGAELGYKILGEGAAARAALIGRATVEIDARPGELDATITARDGATTLVFAAVRRDGEWRFAPSPALLVDEDELFKLPTGSAQTVGAASVEAAAAAWIAALNGGTGWDAYNLVAPSNRVRLKALVAQMGGSGDEDVVRILDKTIRDRRDRGITATTPAIEPGTGDSRTIVFHYSNGSEDRFEAVREAGAWWIVMPI